MNPKTVARMIDRGGMHIEYEPGHHSTYFSPALASASRIP